MKPTDSTIQTSPSADSASALRYLIATRTGRGEHGATCVTRMPDGRWRLAENLVRGTEYIVTREHTGRRRVWLISDRDIQETVDRYRPTVHTADVIAW